MPSKTSTSSPIAMNTRSKSKGTGNTASLKPSVSQQKIEVEHHEDAVVPLQTTMTVQSAPTIWATPLFSWANLTRYTYTFFCPCTIMYEILMEELIHVHHHSPQATMPTVTVGGGCCCSCLSHLFVPCCFGQCFPVVWPGQYSQVVEEEPSFIDSLEVSSLLQDFCSCCPTHIINTQPEIPQHNNNNDTASLCNHAMMLSMGCVVASGCFIPSTCILRQITTQKYHHTTSESCWNSGLVSCFAWPCGLVQVMDEIHIQESMMLNTQS